MASPRDGFSSDRVRPNCQQENLSEAILSAPRCILAVMEDTGICVAEFVLHDLNLTTSPFRGHTKFQGKAQICACKVQLWERNRGEPTLGWISFQSVSNPAGTLAIDEPFEVWAGTQYLGKATLKIWPVMANDIVKIGDDGCV